MKQRVTIEIKEVLAVIDERISIVRDKQQYLRRRRSVNEPVGWRARKRSELRVECLQLQGLRRSISSLRYGPRLDWRQRWAKFVQSACRPVL